MPDPTQPVAGDAARSARRLAVLPDGRRFVCFPRLDPGPSPAFTLAEWLADGTLVPYPDTARNALDDGGPAGERLVSVQAIAQDARGRLWVLDGGLVGGSPTLAPGGPKLVCLDPATGLVERAYPFPAELVGPQGNLNDFHLDPGRGPAGTVFLCDSGEEGLGCLIVLDLATGRAWRRLVNDPPARVAGPFPHRDGVNRLALSPGGQFLFWTSLIGYRLHRAPADLLADPGLPDAALARAVENLRPWEGNADGLEPDTRAAIAHFLDCLGREPGPRGVMALNPEQIGGRAAQTAPGQHGTL